MVTFRAEKLCTTPREFKNRNMVLKTERNVNEVIDDRNAFFHDSA